jgi:hypothetical protein
MSQLSQFPYPIYFVNLNSDKWQDLLTHPELPDDLKILYEKCIVGDDIWSTQLVERTLEHKRQLKRYVHLQDQGARLFPLEGGESGSREANPIDRVSPVIIRQQDPCLRTR